MWERSLILCRNTVSNLIQQEGIIPQPPLQRRKHLSKMIAYSIAFLIDQSVCKILLKKVALPAKVKQWDDEVVEVWMSEVVWVVEEEEEVVLMKSAYLAWRVVSRKPKKGYWSVQKAVGEHLTSSHWSVTWRSATKYSRLSERCLTRHSCERHQSLLHKWCPRTRRDDRRWWGSVGNCMNALTAEDNSSWRHTKDMWKSA